MIEWIKTKDKLPEDDEYKWCLLSGYKNRTANLSYDDGIWRDGCSDTTHLYLGKVTHWLEYDVKSISKIDWKPLNKEFPEKTSKNILIFKFNDDNRNIAIGNVDDRFDDFTLWSDKLYNSFFTKSENFGYTDFFGDKEIITHWAYVNEPKEKEE